MPILLGTTSKNISNFGLRMKNQTTGKEILITEQTFSIKKDHSFCIGSNKEVNARKVGSAHLSDKKLTH